MLSRNLAGPKLARLVLPVSVMLAIATAIAILVILALTQAKAESTGAEMTMVPGSGDLERGATGDFNVRVDPNGVAGITGAQFAIKFDPSALQLKSITHVNTRLELSATPAIDNTVGTAIFLAFTLTALTGDHPAVDFATVRFKAKAAAPPGSTDVIFEWADGGKKTAVAGPGGNVLKNTGDYLAVRINIEDGCGRPRRGKDSWCPIRAT